MSIGCTGERCVSTDSPQVAAAWLGVCAAGHTQERHKRPERVTTCGTCSRLFDLTHLYDWTHRGRPGQMHPNYDAELDRLRAGKHIVLLPVGAKARVTVSGEHQGSWAGSSSGGARPTTCAPVGSVLRVPFACVEPTR